MAATTSSIDATLKEVYEGMIEDQFNSEVLAIARVEKNSEGVESDTGGKYVTFPIHIKRNSGVGMRNENEQMPTPGQQSYTNVRVPLHYGYGRLRLTGPTIDLSQDNKKAFAKVLDQEMDGLKNDVVKDSNRQIYGNGVGVLATVTADGANTVTVDNIQYLSEGMVVDIAKTASPYTVLASAREITAINETTLVVTYSGADVAADATYSLFVSGNAGKEVSGFDIITDNVLALHNVDPATVSKWKGQKDASGGVNRPLAESLWLTTIDNIRRRGGGRPTVGFTSLGVRRAYFNLLQQQRRFVNTMEFTGGFKALAFDAAGGEIPIVDDPDCKPNRTYWINEKKLELKRTKPWYFEDRDGAVMKWVPDFDSFDAYCKQYYELATRQRNSNGVTLDITEA